MHDTKRCGPGQLLVLSSELPLEELHLRHQRPVDLENLSLASLRSCYQRAGIVLAFAPPLFLECYFSD